MGEQKKSSGTRKYKRNQSKCEKYRRAKKREKSHVRRIRKHLQHNPKDEQARDALKEWEARL